MGQKFSTMNRHVPWDFDPLSLFLVDKIPSVLVMFPEFKCQLVGGLEHEFYFSIYWECHHPNWQSQIFQSSSNQPMFDDAWWIWNHMKNPQKPHVRSFRSTFWSCFIGNHRPGNQLERCWNLEVARSHKKAPGSPGCIWIFCAYHRLVNHRYY